MVARNRQINAPKSEADSKDCEKDKTGIHAHVNGRATYMRKRGQTSRSVFR